MITLFKTNIELLEFIDNNPNFKHNNFKIGDKVNLNPKYKEIYFKIYNNHNHTYYKYIHDIMSRFKYNRPIIYSMAYVTKNNDNKLHLCFTNDSNYIISDIFLNIINYNEPPTLVY